VLEKQSNVLGPDHPSTLLSSNNFGNCYQKIGQFEKAISIHQDVPEK